MPLGILKSILQFTRQMKLVVAPNACSIRSAVYRVASWPALTNGLRVIVIRPVLQCGRLQPVDTEPHSSVGDSGDSSQFSVSLSMPAADPQPQNFN